MRKAKFIVFILVQVVVCYSVKAQVSGGPTVTGQSPDEQRNVITTAMPFLLISPDSRSAGMGDVGVALSADANSMQWNAARLAFVENEIGASVSYSPWLTSIGVNDMSISYLSGYYRLDQEQVIGISMKYFDLGSIFFTDTGVQGDGLEASPKDFSIAVAYARKLSDNLSASLTARIARSNLFGDYQGSSLQDPKPATALGVDIGLLYTKPVIFNGNDSDFSAGLQLSNISNKITYSNSDNEQFLPINLKIGTAFTTALDAYNSLTISIDLNKLMVPTPNPEDSTSNRNNIGVLPGMFGSFSDAPGGFNEELREISIASGLEYWYNDVFAVRTGYFYEHLTKGGRQYFTAGLGFRYQVLGLDFSYLIPVARQNPLGETLRFTACFNMENLNSSNRKSITE